MNLASIQYGVKQSMLNAMVYLDNTSFVSNAYHDARRILEAAYSAIGTETIKVHVHQQSNGRVVAFTLAV